MSDPKPDRILAEESDNPWVKLILWAHEDSVRGTERWNGFIKYLVEERLDTDSAAFKSALPLSGEALEHAKNFFPNNADFKKDQLVITIENHIFSEELNFNGAIFAQPISFTNCRFKRSVNFYKANFERAARFSGSKFLETVDFGNAQFRVAALFERVTFCGKIIFYWSENESNLLANFRKAIFKKMTPVFHGRNFHPAWDFHGVTWPKIPKRNGDKKTQDTIEDTLLYHITSYEYICTQAENIGQLELRKEMIRQELACRAELAEPSFERYLRKAYGWICDHGTSIGRPALALLCIWGFTFLAWRGWAAQEAAVTTWDVLYHTGGRMVPFVGGHAYIEEHTLKALRAAPHVLHFLSAMAAILSPFLLFLMALALRLKFRMSV
ncbi:pentapeptide repeat-containing protein [bacterium]|nr:pentapeptide repeat-containing protein [Planktomarina temperata]MDC1271771.1 pentapeptide repeat-containing protein [Planktomarina temperata]MDC3275498.1 pentapeptide repeat-containing protein [bacterium]